MAKRVSLSERKANTPKGVDAIIQPTETEITQTQSSAATKTDSDIVEKVTVYIRPDQVVELEKIQLSERQKTGKKPKKSVLVQEALDLLIQKYSKK